MEGSATIKRYYRNEREKIYKTIGLGIIVMIIPIITIAIVSRNIKNDLNILQYQMDNNTKILNNILATMDDDIVVFVKISNFGYFSKLNRKMTFRSGQEACSKMNSHIVEFDFEDEKSANAKIDAIVEKYGLPFFIGLTDDLSKDGVWTWNFTRKSFSPKGQKYWMKYQPNQQHSKNCVEIRNSKNDSKLKYGFKDFGCSSWLSEIICEKNSP